MCLLRVVIVSDWSAMSNLLRIVTRSYHLIRQRMKGGGRCSVNRLGIDQHRTGTKYMSATTYILQQGCAWAMRTDY